MTNYKINGHAVRIGDEWVSLDGTKLICKEIDAGDPEYPLVFGIKNAPGCAPIRTTGNGEYDVEDVTHPFNVVDLIRRAEPDKPEDIAHLYEVVPEEGIERELLHAYQGHEGVIFFYYRMRDRKADPWWYSHATTESDGHFRLREQWVRGCFVPAESDDTKGLTFNGADYFFEYERNTVTGEVRRVEG